MVGNRAADGDAPVFAHLHKVFFDSWSFPKLSLCSATAILVSLTLIWEYARIFFLSTLLGDPTLFKGLPVQIPAVDGAAGYTDWRFWVELRSAMPLTKYPTSTQHGFEPIAANELYSFVKINIKLYGQSTEQTRATGKEELAAESRSSSWLTRRGKVGKS